MGEPRSNPNLKNSRATMPTNEELIDSLMTGLEECVVNETVSTSSNKNSSLELSEIEKHSEKSSDSDIPVISDGSKVERNSLNDSKTTSTTQDNCDEESEHSELPTSEDDLVDELKMKDLELTYTDEDRERLRKQAEEFKLKGNDLFKCGEYKESALTYTQALRTCPLTYAKERAILYSNRAAAKMKLELNESAIEDCDKALELDEGYLKALYRRAQLYETTEKLDEALADYNKILTIDPLHKEALCASKRLPDEIQERNEKLKTEMLGKLKDLGNMFLRPFGLSTDNFQLNQDPNSGGYSVNFKS